MNQCLNCKKPTANPKYCCRSCSATQNNKIAPKRKLTRKCLECDTIVSNWRQYRCIKHLQAYKISCAESYKFKTLAEYHEHLSVKGKHSSWKNSHIRVFNRAWNKNLTLLPCKNCGYNKHVELCHIKSVSSFPKTATLGEVNAATNNIQLCRNCHWEFDNGLLVI